MTRERLATLSFLVMESLIWFALAWMLAGGAGGSGPWYPTVLLASLGGFGLTRALQRFELSTIAVVLVGAGLSVLTLNVLLNLQYNTGGSPLSFGWHTGFFDSPEEYLRPRWPQTWGVIFTVAAWFRGVHAAQQDFSYGMVLASFSVGLLIFVLALIFGGGTRAGERISLAAMPFFAAGLLTLALIQLRRAEEADAGFARGPWLPIVLGTVGGLAVVSALIGIFPLGLFYRLLTPVGMLALRILDLVIYAIALPIGLLASFIISRLVNRNTEWPPEAARRLATDNAERIQEQGERSALVAGLLVILKFLFIVAVIAVVAYVLYRVFKHLRRPPRQRDELRETVEREGGIGDDLNALWNGLLGRFRGALPHAREPDLPEGVRRVRRLYVDLLDDAEQRGAARPPPATPHEFAPDLRRTYGTPAPERLSERFASARYGMVEPTREELDALQRELDAAKRAGT